MRISFTTLIFLFVLSCGIEAQTLPTWQRAYNDPAGLNNECEGLDGCQLRNGNLIVSAVTIPKKVPPEPPSSVIFVLNPFGDIIDSIPFNTMVDIKFTIPDKAEYSLNVFNVLGQKIKGVFNETFTRGEYTRQINLSSFSSGMYFIRLSSDKLNITKKMIILK